MSVNQFTLPNTYVPPVSFDSVSSANISTAAISNEQGVEEIKLNPTFNEIKMPCNITDIFGASYNNRMTFSQDGNNTSLKLQSQNAGTGSYIALQNPAGDFDLRIAVDNASALSLQCKSDLSITDENAVPSIILNKTPGLGLAIRNPNIVNYTPSNLTCYEEKTITSTLNGFTAPENITMRFTRIGNLVTASFSNINASATGGIVELVANDITEPFRPTLATNCCIPKTFSNSVPGTGNINILPNGNLSCEYVPDLLFPVQPNSGWDNFSFSYLV